jgi:hypothetical protein
MKIVVVGGGTAGWLAALFFKKIKGDHREVTVIDDSKIGPLGAGEAGTGLMTDVIQNNLWNFGCNEQEFFEETSSTIKLAILHQDWKAVGERFLAPIDSSETGQCDHDIVQLHAIANNIPAHQTTLNGYLAEKNKNTFFEQFINLDNFDISKVPGFRSHAYNFDAFAVGRYLKKVCLRNAVRHIDNHVTGFDCDTDGNIVAANVASGEKIAGDFFVDASGFKKIIFKDVLNVSWKSYKTFLPVDRAMPFLLEHKEDKEIPAVMKAWAQKNGWMWQTPTRDRMGCGYVFSSDFTTPEAAQDEIEQVLGHKINPIKILSYDTGRFEHLWYKNCLAVGLAAAFAEPLEATSIQSTIVQLWKFCSEFLDKCDLQDLNQQKKYNTEISRMYDDYCDFLNVHYSGGRTDSEFWKYMSSDDSKTPFVKNLLDICKTRIPNNNDYNNYFGSVGSPLYNIILHGLGKITKEQAKTQLEDLNQSTNAMMLWSRFDRVTTAARDKCIDNDKFVKLYRNKNKI